MFCTLRRAADGTWSYGIRQASNVGIRGTPNCGPQSAGTSMRSASPLLLVNRYSLEGYLRSVEYLLPQMDKQLNLQQLKAHDVHDEHPVQALIVHQRVRPLSSCLLYGLLAELCYS